MSTILKINKQAYINLNKDDFGSFGTNVGEVGTDNPTYVAQDSAIRAVADSAANYDIALSAFNTNRGKDRTDNLSNARIDLETKLKALVELLELAAPEKTDPAAFLTGLGFTLAKVPSRKTGIVLAPIAKTVVSGGKNAPRGKVSFVLKAESPDEIKTIVGRRSDDDGATWVEGIVATKLAFALTDQPSGKTCIYKFMFLATNNRKSDWSIDIPITVY
ncbi:MAG: hypothetical protein GC192_01750 [Bacteroidetes bacterium]|nr:hypothetical protein [Bacteroidota bacterium]